MSLRASRSRPVCALAKWIAILSVLLLHSGCTICDELCGGSIDPRWSLSLEPIPNPEIQVRGCIGSECWTSAWRPSPTRLTYCAAEAGSRLGCTSLPNGDGWDIEIWLQSESVAARVGTPLTVFVLETSTGKVLLDEQTNVPKRKAKYECGCH